MVKNVWDVLYWKLTVNGMNWYGNDHNIMQIYADANMRNIEEKLFGKISNNSLLR